MINAGGDIIIAFTAAVFFVFFFCLDGRLNLGASSLALSLSGDTGLIVPAIAPPAEDRRCDPSDVSAVRTPLPKQYIQFSFAPLHLQGFVFCTPTQ